MTINIHIPDRLVPKRMRERIEFVQSQWNRLAVGGLRYEPKDGPQPENCYMSRLFTEVKAYKRTGNAEHLLNAANYCMLESLAPENPRFHRDAGVASVTRKKYGGRP